MDALTIKLQDLMLSKVVYQVSLIKYPMHFTGLAIQILLTLMYNYASMMQRH